MFYQRAEVLSKRIVKITLRFPSHEKYVLGDQIRRSADSMVSNIPEGGGKDSVKEMVSYLRNSLGNTNELESQIKRIIGLRYIKSEEGSYILKELREIARMINGFIRKLREKGEGDGFGL